jgi:hypothetical protein
MEKFEMSLTVLLRTLLGTLGILGVACGHSSTAPLTAEVKPAESTASAAQSPLSSPAPQPGSVGEHRRQTVIQDSVDDRVLATIVQRVRCVPVRDCYYCMSSKKRLSLYGQQTYDDLILALAASDKQLAALAGSGDGRSISLAVFVAWQRGDSPALLRMARENLDSRLMAIPEAIEDAQGGALQSAEQPLVGQLSEVMASWFGTLAASTPEEFDRVFPGYPAFAAAGSWVYPWLHRSRHARVSGNLEDWKSFVRDIQELPEVNRVVVAALRFTDGSGHPPAECRELMGTLSEQSRAELLGGAAFLPDEPWFRKDTDGSLREFVRSSLRELLK